MDYSLNKRKISLGKLKGKEMFVASAVCQKQRVSFDQLCERMAEDSTVGQADVAAVFYKFRNILNRLCSQGYIVDGGPLGTFRPTFTSKAVEKEEDFKPSECISKTHSDTGVPPAEECRVLPGGKAGEEEREGRRQEQGWRNRAPIGK